MTAHDPDREGRAAEAEAIDPARARREQGGVALLFAALVIALAFLFYVALFDVSSTVEWVIFAAVVLAAIVAMGVVHLVSTPSRELAHPAKVRRQQRHAAMLSGALIALLLLLAYAAAFDLDSWAEWVVLGAIVLGAVGAVIAVQTRAT